MAAEYKTIYDNADDIPESIEDFRGLFTEKNGKMELTGIGGVQTPANVSRLETSLKKEREDHKATKATLAVWGDLTHDDVVAKLDRIPELEAAAGDKLDDAKIEEIVNRRVEGVIRSKLSPLERENKKLTKENGELSESNAGFVASDTKRKVHDSMRKARKSLKVLDEAEDDVLNYSGLFEITEDGGVVTRDGVGVAPGMDPTAWLSEVQGSKPHWWPASQGGGAGGSNRGGGAFGGKNPFTAENWSMTEQAQIVTKDGMEKAEKLAAAAGIKVGDLKPALKRA